MHKQQLLNRTDPRFSEADLAEHETEWEVSRRHRLPREEDATAAAADATTEADFAAWLAAARAGRDSPGG